MTSTRYTREELHRDLDNLLNDWDDTHQPADPIHTSNTPPRKPRRIWLGSMTDITDDYPYATVLSEALPSHE